MHNKNPTIDGAKVDVTKPKIRLVLKNTYINFIPVFNDCKNRLLRNSASGDAVVLTLKGIFNAVTSNTLMINAVIHETDSPSDISKGSLATQPHSLATSPFSNNFFNKAIQILTTDDASTRNFRKSPTIDLGQAGFTKSAIDATFTELRKHYSEKEVVENYLAKRYRELLQSNGKAPGIDFG